MKYNLARTAVVNDVMTYLAIAKLLQERGVCIIAWEDTKGTRYDILFAVRVPQFGVLGGGQKGDKSLFVTIMRRGGFGFSADQPGEELGDIYPSYVAEKLGLPAKGYTTEKVTALVNGVMAAHLGMSMGGA